MALPWLVALVVTAVIWGAPVVKVGSPLWLVFLVDIVYLTVVYALLAWGWQKQRRVDGSGRLAAAVLSVDAALRLVAGLVLGVYLPVPLAEQTANHVTRAVAAALGAVFLLGTRQAASLACVGGAPRAFLPVGGMALGVRGARGDPVGCLLGDPLLASLPAMPKKGIPGRKPNCPVGRDGHVLMGRSL